MQLLWERGGKRYVATFHAVDIKQADKIFSRAALRILEILDTPKTLAEIAEIFGTTPQAVFYHLKRLLEAGVVRTIPSQRNGRTVKAYVRNSDSYGVIFAGREAARASPIPRPLYTFFSPLVEDSKWSAPIVVGAPDPHGFYLQRARDGHYAGALCFFLGRYFSFSGFPVRVDTDVLAEWQEQNMLLVGGPVSNVVSLELTERTKHFFDLERPWMILGKKEQYTEPSVGVIAKQREGDRWYILLAGVSALGTKAAVYALIHHWEALLTNYSSGEYYWVVQGMDRDGDGQIDMVKVLEHGSCP